MLAQLGGFAVFAVGLVVPMVALIIGIAVVWLAAKWMKTSLGKWAMGLAATLVITLALMSDEMLGNLYFNRLCATESGVKVHRQVLLPADYWTKDDAPRFIKTNGDLNNEILGHKFRLVVTSREIPHWFGINELQFILVDNESRSPIGQASSFGYLGGWLRKVSASHPVAARCPNAPRSYEEAIVLAAIKPGPR